jgi:sigma-B regulation protein RsbU (phosphoserine phosphatase)
MLIKGEQFFTTFFRDITERKLAEQTIRDREERLSAFTTALPDLAFIIDEDGRYEAILSSQEEHLVLPKDEMLGKRFHDLLPLELADKLLATIKSALDTGEIQLIEYTLEMPVGQLWYEGRCAQITESLGDKRLAVLLVRDITERKQLEAQILQQKEMLENTIESLTHPFYVIDADDYSILLANSAAKELGISGETQCYALTHRRDTPCDSLEDPCPLVEVKKRKEPFSVEHTHFDKDGNERYAEVHGYPIFDADGNVIQMIEYSLDITKRKQMEAQLELANERMSEELNFARDIQMGLLPLIFPAFPTRSEFNIFASLIPAREVGGDFYDFYFVDEHHLCFVVGDVSGKGAPGALLMAVSKTLIKSRAMDDFSPSSILTHVNTELSQNNDAAMFVTVFLGIMDIRTGKIEYTNAGHNPPFIRRKDGSIEKLDEFHGPVIGALPGLHYKENSTILERNDTIVVYTDGITESMNIEDELYLDTRLEQFLAADILSTPQKLCDQVVRDVKRHEGDAEQSDDITILALQFTGYSDLEEIGRLEVKIKNQITELAVVEEKFETFCQEYKIPDLARQQISMVLDEMLNNVVSYAYRDQEEHIIDIEFVLSGNRLVITVRDDGVPFNPFALDPPNIAMTLDEREIGGLGIYLVRNVMDEYMYNRHIGRNVVTLVKLIESE